MFRSRAGNDSRPHAETLWANKCLVITTNLPFARWSEVFLDATAAAAVIDRVVHHATILKTEGESYRLQDARRRKKSAS